LASDRFWSAVALDDIHSLRVQRDHDINKHEGHWRQMKVHLPTHGRKKELFSWYLAEYFWRYYVNRGKDLFKLFLKDVARVYKLD